MTFSLADVPGIPSLSRRFRGSAVADGETGAIGSFQTIMIDLNQLIRNHRARSDPICRAYKGKPLASWPSVLTIAGYCR